LASWSPARQTADYSQSSRRVSAFVKPQRSRHPPTNVPTSFASRHPDTPQMPGIVPPMSSFLQNPSLATSSGPPDPFNLSAMLPYHQPPPLWAGSNIFYHFAIPPNPNVSSSNANLDLSSSMYNRPLHLPPPSGCTIAGCRDCLPLPLSTLMMRQERNNSGTNETIQSESCSVSDSPSPPPHSPEDSNIDVDSIRND
jgi:hypothetical protein